MSAENVARVREAIEAFNERGIDAIGDLIAPDFETSTPPALSVEPDTYRGPEGVRRWMESWGDTMSEVRFEIDDLIDAGDRVVVELRLVARSSSTGIELEQPQTQVWTVDGAGRATRMEAFAARAEALRAAGLTP